ncbi:tetratricopeptide repeat protein [Micromonospora sp. M71_S20]|uniref:ATP-binding protein n=1 Tax=Micromonospora sp. M71_S20 TaxID=592872 RepID=UPI000EB42634|nr:tetratricopeptide repeat protein [Micromonospora sp. M71_S20]RLK25793.1 tetratricopeptide repeat protein [Micromonospora sp. M71_S20]
MSEPGREAQEALAWFVGELRRLRQLSGAPSLNTLVAISTALRQPLARSTLSDKLNAKSLPEWPFVVAFVEACLAHADRAGIRLPAELAEMSHWDAAHWRLLRIADAARTEDRLRAAAHTQLGRRSSGGSTSAGGPEPSSPPLPTDRPTGVLELVTPRQLPTAVPCFVGRRAALAGLAGLLPHMHGAPGTTTICLISGTAGVGKTTLAVGWAHQVADHFPDGQLYVNLRGFDATGPATNPAEVLREFLEALGVPALRVPAGPDARSALFRSLLTGRRVLVLLDNAGDADQVRPLLPGSPGCLVVVTSRGHLPGLVTIEGARPLVLDPLSRTEAYELLSRRLGTDRVENEPDAANRIVDAAAGLPLALAIVAGRAAAQPGLSLGRLADELTRQGGLDRFSYGDAATDIRTVFSWSYRSLDATSARAFRLLGLHPGPDVSVPALASLAGVPVAEAGRTMAALVRANLVSEQLPERYVLHDLLRAYAAELVAGHEPEEARAQALGRLLDCYLHTAHAADLLLYDQRDPIDPAPARTGTTVTAVRDRAEAWRWLTTEHRVLLAVVGLATDARFDTHAWQLAWAVNTYLDRLGAWQEQLVVQERALRAASRVADRDGQARAHRNRAVACLRLEDHDQAHAHLHRSLRLYTELGNAVGSARAHLNLGILAERLGRYEQALHHAQQALGLFAAGENTNGQANALNNIGWYHSQLGNYQQALDNCTRALVLQQRVGNRYWQAHTWDSLGYVHYQLEQQAEAIRCYENALALWREAAERYYEATTLTHLGDSHRAAGAPDLAHRAWRGALEILEQLGHLDAEQVRDRLRSEPAQSF